MQENFNKGLEWYHSSKGDGSISLTLKSSLLGLLPIFVFLAQYYGVALTENEIVEIINQTVAIVSIVGILYGTIRKVLYSI